MTPALDPPAIDSATVVHVVEEKEVRELHP